MFVKQKFYLVWGTARQGMQLLIIAEPRLSPITCRRQQQSCKQLALAAMQGQAAGGVNWCRCRSGNGLGILPNIWKVFSEHKRGGRLAEGCFDTKDEENMASIDAASIDLSQLDSRW
jgi:hypothetical protein